MWTIVLELVNPGALFMIRLMTHNLGIRSTRRAECRLVEVAALSDGTKSNSVDYCLFCAQNVSDEQLGVALTYTARPGSPALLLLEVGISGFSDQ